jgi:transposase
MAEMTLKPEDLVTLSDAAKILNISRPSVYNWITKYNLNPVVIGNNRYLLRSELEMIKNKGKDEPSNIKSQE